jgi:hypothetical protein
MLELLFMRQLTIDSILALGWSGFIGGWIVGGVKSESWCMRWHARICESF